MVLCAGSAYEQKYYLGPEFEDLPRQIKDELQIMTVVFLERVGGVLLLNFDDEGYLTISTQSNEEDITYDEIEAKLQVRALQKEKAELFESLERYYAVFFGDGPDEELEKYMEEMDVSDED